MTRSVRRIPELFMADFEVESFQNEYLSPDATRVDAIVTVTAHGGDAPTARTNPPGPRAEVIIIDVSSSMQGDRIEQARLAAMAAVTHIDDGVEFAVIAGNGRARQVYPEGEAAALAVSSPDTRAEAVVALSALEASGNTAIDRWLTMATGLLRDRDGTNHAILLTDGRNGGLRRKPMTRALEAATGVFQCDCRGVGTNWKVAELRRIATALLGSVDIVAEPDDLAADFTQMMQTSMSRGLGELALHVWTPIGATIAFVKQVSPELVDLTDHGVRVDDLTAVYPTGAWGEERRDYHVSIRVSSRGVGSEVLAGRVRLLVDGERVGQALIRAVWTDDAAQSTRIDRRVAHYTGQAEVADLVQEGLHLWRVGDAEQATRKLGPALRLARESGNKELADSIEKVLDIEDPTTGTVRLKRKLDPLNEMSLDIVSTKTTRARP